jgi:GTP-binding protein HflX
MKKADTDRSGRGNRESAYIVHPVHAGSDKRRKDHTDLVLDEAAGLVRAIGLELLDMRAVKVARISPGHFLGKGQREIVLQEIERLKPSVVIFNGDLSPVQQRNLEKDWQAKVIDRKGLILEIFGRRAQTREGRLQVELAALEYQKSRIVRSWTHLERQRGGAGFMGGPGERQLELDRRMISEKIERLKRDIEKVRRTRDLARKSRERVPFPVIALVGYTNAGKSTLFNTLTDAGVLAEDLPFATLDPTMRRIKMPGGQPAILSDTVGFITDLPTHLVAAFRATLEQIAYADVIAHVIDVSRGDYAAQREDVIKILQDLGIDYEQDARVLELYNKADALSPEKRQDLERKVRFQGSAVLISALEGEGLESFMKKAAAIVSSGRKAARFCIRITDGKALAWLHRHTEILKRKDKDDTIEVEVMIEDADIGKFREHYGYEPQKQKKPGRKKGKGQAA